MERRWPPGPDHVRTSSLEPLNSFFGQEGLNSTLVGAFPNVELLDLPGRSWHHGMLGEARGDESGQLSTVDGDETGGIRMGGCAL